jgi:hypothetical protein
MVELAIEAGEASTDGSNGRALGNPDLDVRHAISHPRVNYLEPGVLQFFAKITVIFFLGPGITPIEEA